MKAHERYTTMPKRTADDRSLRLRVAEEVHYAELPYAPPPRPPQHSTLR